MNIDFHLTYVFATSLALGLLIGLERERHSDSKAGLRTFALTALFGTLSALLTDKIGSGWILAAGIFVMGGMMIVSHGPPKEVPDDPGTTTIVALLVCYLLGALIWFGFTYLSVVLALSVTALLYFKPELHGLSQRLSRRDLVSFLQFSAISFVVLPLLPDKDYGPYGALNPHEIWLMVVLVSGLSLSGYVALRHVGERQGIILVGLLGGAVSSTATTLVYSRQHRSGVAPIGIATVVILLANLAVLIRLSLIAGVIAPKILPQLLPLFAIGLLAGTLVAVREWLKMKLRHVTTPPTITNPAELHVAVGFGMVFAIVLVATAWLNDLAGASGVYTVAVVSGLTDMDAISLSTLKMFNLGQLTAAQVGTAIAVAYGANLSLKILVVLTVGGRELAARVMPGYLTVGLGLFAGWIFL